MAYEQRDNSGTLFVNDKHPNAKGKAMIDGKMYWVSAWTKEGSKGKFQSLAFQLMDEQPDQGRQRNEPVDEPPFGEPEFQDEDIPF